MESKIKIEEVKLTEHKQAKFEALLVSLYEKESLNTITCELAKRVYTVLNKMYYKELSKQRVKDMEDNGYPIYQVKSITELEMHRDEDLQDGPLFTLNYYKKEILGYFMLATLDSGRLHLPEVLFETEEMSFEKKKDIYQEILSYLEFLALISGITEVSLEYHDADAAYQEALLDNGYELIFDEQDYETDVHIAQKKIKRKQENEGNNSSTQRTRVNKQGCSKQNM